MSDLAAARERLASERFWVDQPTKSKNVSLMRAHDGSCVLIKPKGDTVRLACYRTLKSEAQPFWSRDFLLNDWDPRYGLMTERRNDLVQLFARSGLVSMVLLFTSCADGVAKCFQGDFPNPLSLGSTEAERCGFVVADENPGFPHYYFSNGWREELIAEAEMLRLDLHTATARGV